MHRQQIRIAVAPIAAANDPEGSPPPMTPFERVDEALEVAALFGPLPGVDRPPQDGMVLLLKEQFDALRRINAANRKGKHVQLANDTRKAITDALKAWVLEQERDKGRSFRLRALKGDKDKGWRERCAAAVRIVGEEHVAVDWRTLKRQLPLWGFPNGEADLIEYMRTQSKFEK